MTEHIELTEEQKEFIKERFVHGETLLDKVIEFEEHKNTTSLIFEPARDGIAVAIRHIKNIDWMNAFREMVFVDFKKEVK